MDGDAPVVGLVARVDPMKGHGVFCRAAALVRARIPAARFVFCGEGTEPGAAELDGLIAANGLAGAVVRLGRRGDAEAVMAALDVLALASLGEGFPNVVAEASACGVPVAGLDVGDARRVAGPGGAFAGPSVSAPDADGEARARALAEALCFVLELPPAQRAEMGARGRAHVLAEFGLDAAAARWAAYFESLAARR